MFHSGESRWHKLLRNDFPRSKSIFIQPPIAPNRYFHATQAHSAWPSLVGSYNEYWQWFQPPLGRKGEFWVATGPVTMRDNSNLKSWAYKYVGITTYEPNTKSNPNPNHNPNPATKQCAIASEHSTKVMFYVSR